MKYTHKPIKMLLDIFFPPKCMFCQEDIVTYEEYKVCNRCLSTLPYTKNDGCFEALGDCAYLISPLVYDKKVKKAICDLKFKSKYENASLLSKLMINYVKNIDEAKCADIVVNVPLSKKSMLERGFNQAELLAEPIADYFGIKFMKNSLIKTRETKRQSSLTTFAERAQNTAGAYKGMCDFNGKTVLLVDDIYTSGMTLYHCSKELIACGAKKIIALTAANAHKDIGMSTHDYKASRLVFDRSYAK